MASSDPFSDGLGLGDFSASSEALSSCKQAARWHEANVCSKRVGLRRCFIIVGFIGLK